MAAFEFVVAVAFAHPAFHMLVPDGCLHVHIGMYVGLALRCVRYGCLPDGLQQVKRRFFGLHGLG